MRFLILCFLAVAASAQTRLSVVNSDDNAITFITPQGGPSASAPGFIKVSDGPQAIVVAEDHRRLFVSATGANVVDVLDLRTLKVTKSIPVGAKPAGMALSPNGRFLFVCIHGGAAVDVIDTAALARVKSIPVGAAPGNIYVTPDGTRLIAASEGDKKLIVINIRSQAKEFEIPLGSSPLGITIESDRHLVIERLFVQTSAGYEIIDYAARKPVGKFAPPGGATALVIAPDRRTIWATHSPADGITSFSMPGLTKLQTAVTGGNPASIALAADGKRAYVSLSEANVVAVIDTATYKELARIPAGKKPGQITVLE